MCVKTAEISNEYRISGGRDKMEGWVEEGTRWRDGVEGGQDGGMR